MAVNRNDPDFIAWLRGLAPGFDSLPPERKMSLARQFEEERARVYPVEHPLITEFKLRHGADFANKLSARDKMRLAEITGARTDSSKVPLVQRKTQELTRLKARLEAAKTFDERRQLEEMIRAVSRDLGVKS
jgi:hypothetical protein